MHIDSPETWHTWLIEQKLSLALTMTSPHPANTERGGQLVLLGSREDKKPFIYLRTFERSGGLAFAACSEASMDGFCMVDCGKIHYFFNSHKEKAPQSNQHDTYFLPNHTSYTGEIGVRDVGYDKNGRLFFLSTALNRVMTLGKKAQTTVVWQPADLQQEGLNNQTLRLTGLAFRNQEPRYVTGVKVQATPSMPNAKRAEAILTQGFIIIDIQTHEIMAQGDWQAFSPVWHDNKLWVLTKGEHETGQLGYINANKQWESVMAYDGEAKCCRFHQHTVLIGLTKSTKEGYENTLHVMDLKTREKRHALTLTGDGVILNDVMILPNVVIPKIVSVHDKERLNHLHIDEKPITQFFEKPPFHNSVKQKAAFKSTQEVNETGEAAPRGSKRTRHSWYDYACVFFISPCDGCCAGCCLRVYIDGATGISNAIKKQRVWKW